MKKIITIILLFIDISVKAQCWSSIDAGGAHSMALQDNAMWTWGYNCSGQLGNGTILNLYSPTQIDSSTDWKLISGDVFHSLGIKTNGTLWAWGRNTFGEIGDSSFIDKLTPVQIGTDTTWEIVSAGYENSYAMKTDKTIWGWGANGYSELGSIPGSSKNIPTQIGSDSTWKSIQAGYRDAMGIREDSTLWLWGWNSYGQIGNGTQIVQNTPFQVGSSKWLEVSGGWTHTLAIKSDGTLWAWGDNNNQKLGDSSLTSIHYLLPIQIGSDSNWHKIQAGYSHSVGIKDDGTLWTWGVNGYGQLGDTTSSLRIEPKQIGLKNNWKEISTGQNFAMALDDNDSLFTWGYNNYGDLGNGTTISNHNILLVNCSISTSTALLYNISEQIKIFPNPSQGYFTVDFTKDDIKEARLYDLLGNLIFQQQTINQIKFTVDNLQNGIYIMTLLHKDNRVTTIKIISSR